MGICFLFWLSLTSLFSFSYLCLSVCILLLSSLFLPFSLLLSLSFFFISSSSDPQHSRQQRSQITTLHLSNSFLFIGTKKGDVMVFRIQATPLINDSAPSYTFVASTHIAARPVLNIFTTDEATPIDITTPPISDSFGERLNSRFQDTPLFHTSLNILIVTGPDREKPTGQMHLYELSLTPPTSLRSSCTVSPMSYVSQKSLNSRMTPQKLTVVSSRNDFTPLREKC